VKKAELLHWLREKHQEWEGVLDEVGQARMEQPGVNGLWSMKDLAALLAVIEALPAEVRIERIEPAYHLVSVNDERFLAGEFFDHFRDDHERDVRAWLAREEKP
jgi:hypothetical protein